MLLPQPEQPGVSFLSYVPLHPRDKLYGFLVRDSAMAAHMHSHIIPARELQAEMRREREAKSVQVDKPAANCLNPDTSTGAIFGEQMLEKLQRKMELQATRAADAVSKNTKDVRRNLKKRFNAGSRRRSF